MSTPAHTPGPWMVLPETGTERIGQFCILTEHGPRLDIASTYGWPDTPIEANARLIAAAPDLLAACIDLTDQLALLANDPKNNPWVKQGREAIAKAEGTLIAEERGTK